MTRLLRKLAYATVTRVARGWSEFTPLENPHRLAVIAAVLTLLICFPLVVTSHTPRARLNVMQVVSVLFFLAVIVRHGRVATDAGEFGRTTCSRRGVVLALVVGAGVWASMIPFYFISDDFAHLYSARGPLLETLWQFLTEGQAGTFFRPVGFASIFLDFSLWHTWAPGYHVTNLLLHLVSITGVFFLCESLGLKAETSTTASLVYSVLPVQAEAVAWMGARFDLLATCLTIWAVTFYVKFRTTGGRGSYCGALVFFLLAMLSKENAYVLPFLLFSVEFFLLPSRRFKPLLGFLLLGGLTFGYRWSILRGVGGYFQPGGEASALHFGFKTFEGLFVRGPTQLLLGYNWLQPPTAGVIVLAALTGAVLLSLALSAKPEPAGRRLIRFCLVWIVLAILPAHFLLMVGAGLTNSRVLYLGSVGSALLVAQLLTGIGPARMRRGATGFLVLLLSLGVLHNLGAWRWTSELSRRLLLEVKQLEPSPPPHAEFVFQDMPDRIRGVFFFHVALPEALNIAYDRRDLSARREGDFPSGSAADASGRPVIKVKWRGEVEPLIKLVSP